MKSKKKALTMSISADPDEDILEAMNEIGGREKAFRLIFERYREKLYWVVRRITRTHEDADDVLQEVFIKVYRHLSSFKGQSKLYSWLYRIATNETLTYIRKEKKREVAYEDLSVFGDRTSEKEFDYDKVMTLLHRAIGQLPEKQKLVFTMRYFHEMNYREISEQLQITTGALKASYHHAVKKVEKYVKENEPG